MIARYPFGVGAEVTGPGIAGRVVRLVGPYSVEVEQASNGARFICSVTTLLPVP